MSEMIKCAVLDKEFATKEEMFADLIANKDKILSLKSATVKESESFGDYNQELLMKFIDENEAIKNELNLESGYYYPVINTTNFMDSHKDVHLDGIWDKSKNEQKGKIFYVTDHELRIKSVIAFPKDVEILTLSVPWKALGLDKDGETQALIYKIAENSVVHESAKMILRDKIDIQNSVRMQYVKIDMAINSNEKGFEKEKALWDSTIDKIVNREDAEKDGYFFPVSEAKIMKEGSMVLFGSNSVTPVLHASEPEKSTHDTETQFEESEEVKRSDEYLYEFLNNIKI